MALIVCYNGVRYAEVYSLSTTQAGRLGCGARAYLGHLRPFGCALGTMEIESTVCGVRSYHYDLRAIIEAPCR